MKISSINYLNEVLISQLNHWVFMPIALLILSLRYMDDAVMPASPNLIMFATLGLLPLYHYLLRKFVNRLWLFMIATVLPISLMWLIKGNSNEKVVLALCVFGYIIYSFAKKFRSDSYSIADSYIGLGAVLAFIPLSVFFMYQANATGWIYVYVYYIVIYTGIYFIYSYVDNFCSYVFLNKNSTSHMPQKQMFKEGFLMVCIYSIVAVIVLFIYAKLDALSKYVRAFFGAINRVIRWLLSHINLTGGDASEVITPTLSDSADSGISLEPGETGLFWIVLEYVAFAAFIAFVIWGIIKIVVKIITYFKSHWTGVSVVKDSLDDVVDVRESVDIVYKKTKTPPKFLERFLNPRDRVRAIYKRSVLKIKDKDPSVLTPCEAGDMINNKNLADVYNKARYSDYNITEAEIKMIER